MPTPLTGFADTLRKSALALPEATEDFPWGERAFKVRGKGFLFLSVSDAVSFSMKLPKSGIQALALPFAEPTHYGLGKHGWVTFTLPRRMSKALEEQFFDWLLESYTAVAPAKLAKTISITPPVKKR
jgi:predicted DNA-binding protein (MmcQ/YjbR family)